MIGRSPMIVISAVLLSAVAVSLVVFLSSLQVEKRVTGEIVRLRTEVTELRTETAELIRCAIEEILHEPAWMPSPLSHLHFADAEAVALLSSNAISARWTDGSREVRFKHPVFSESGDKIELFVEIFQDGIQKYVDVQFASVQIDVSTGAMSSISHTHVSVGLEHATRISDFLTGWPEFVAKLPELLISSLTPIAHYFAGLDNARKLATLIQQLGTLIAYRKIDQKSKVEKIWIGAEGIVTDRKPRRELLVLLVSWRAELFALRRVCQQEILFELSHAPTSWLKERSSRLFYEHITSFPEQVNLLQVSLFTDYCIALATGAIWSFRRALLIWDYLCCLLEVGR